MNALAFGLIVVLLGWISIPLGSHRPVSLGIVALIAAICLTLVAISRIRSGDRLVSQRANVMVPMLLLVAIVGWQVIQLLPLPSVVVALVAPASHAAYAATGIEPQFRFSVDAGAGMRQLILWGTMLFIFVAFAGVVRTNKQLWVMATVLVAVVVVQALAGLVLGFMGTSFVPEQYIDGHFTRVRGSFVNANHFAGFVNVGIGMLVGVFVALAPEKNSRGVVEYHSRGRGLFGIDGMLLVVAGLMACAVLMSGSRGAVLGLGVALAMLGIFMLLARRRREECVRAAAVLGCAGLVAVGVIVFSDAGQRFSESQGMGERVWMWSVALKATMLQPFVGFGGGTFQWMPGLVATELPRNVSYDDAHNLYVETLVEQGVVGLLLLLGFLGVVGFSLLRGLKNQTDTTRVAIISGALCGCTAVLIQAFFDFQLEIPANAVFLIAAMAIALIAADDVWAGMPGRSRRTVS